jgi:glycine cleavage system H protein
MARKDLRYTENHEWIRDDGDVYTVGITDYAAEQLGDVTFVELPEVGDEFAQNEEVATVESVKAASDVYAPVSGRVSDINDSLPEKPELVNRDPYGDGWFFKLDSVNSAELDDLMDAVAYEKYIKEL